MISVAKQRDSILLNKTGTKNSQADGNNTLKVAKNSHSKFEVIQTAKIVKGNRNSQKQQK